MAKPFEKLLDLLYVPKCVGCRQRMRERGNTLCPHCLDRYAEAKEEYCDFCGMEASVCYCVPQALLMNGCGDYRKLAFYKTSDASKVLPRMMYSIKRAYNLPLMRFLAEELAALRADVLPEAPIVTFVPRSETAKRTYGYDQAERIAKFYAEEKQLEFVPLLFRKRFHRHKEQKRLNFSQRAANVQGAYYVPNGERVRGRNVLLVDDIVTSGASVAECVACLYGAGAKNVAVRSVAYTYRKNKRKKD